MSNPAILRPQVHRLAEACSDEREAFQSTATRLIKQQRRLSRFIEQSFAGLNVDDQRKYVLSQMAVYMLSVSLRVFEQVGGRMRKVSTEDINAATARIQGVTDELMPADGAFAARARAIEWRAQPHLLDEILWALFDRPTSDPNEMDLPHDLSALVYMILWASVEALDANWTPARSWSPEAGLLDGEDPTTWTPPEAAAAE
ncbi:MAG: hypothetical protein AAFV53_32110 [Myxococcota bacterium]